MLTVRYLRIAAVLLATIITPGFAKASEIQLYRFSGVQDDGRGDNRGTATSIHCTNFADISHTIRVQIFDFNGARRANDSATVAPGDTYTFSTHFTAFFAEDINLHTGPVSQGSGRIFASGFGIVCTVQMLDAENSVPRFLSQLHLQRLNPQSGTVE